MLSRQERNLFIEITKKTNKSIHAQKAASGRADKHASIYISVALTRDVLKK